MVNQSGQWIKVVEEKRPFPAFNKWLEENKGVSDIEQFGSTPEGTALLNKWEGDYNQLKSHTMNMENLMSGNGGQLKDLKELM